MRAMLTRALEAYKARAEKAGVSYRCLEPDGSPADAVQVRAEDSTILIMGPLDEGWSGVSAHDVIAKMRRMDGEVLNVVVDSPGGFVSEGLSLYSYLRERAAAGTQVNTRSQGLVASAAVLPFLAGDRRTMGDGTMLMVHNPWSFMFLIDDADGIEATAKREVAALRSVTSNYANILASRTNLSADAAKEAMAETTWYDAAEAIEQGYAQAEAAEAESGGGERAKAETADPRIIAMARDILRARAA